MRKLNQMSPGWQTIESFERFRITINRLEKDILAYETNRSTTSAETMKVVNRTVLDASEEPMKDIKALLEAAAKKPEEEDRSLAALRHSSKQDRDHRHNHKRKDREWDGRRSPHERRTRPNRDKADRREPTRLEDLKARYEKRFR